MKSFLLRFSVMILLVLPNVPGNSHAQLRTVIDSVNVTGFPEVVLQLRVMQGDNSVMGLRLQDFTLLENGLVLPITGGYCEDTVTRGPVSVLLVIDASGSMGGWPLGTMAINDAKRAAKNFIDRLSTEDEAALMVFNSEIYYTQSWTTNWPLLKSRIDNIDPWGSTRLWDAVLAGVNVTRSRSKKKVMIVLTDGEDTGSTTPFSTARDAAVADDVMVYTIGLGNNIEENRLRQLAQDTGGKFFKAPQASDLDQIYAEINLSLISTGICELRYFSPIDCWNGDEVTVDVRANTTQGVAAGTARYTLPYDTSTFSYVTLSMEREYAVQSGKRLTVPLELSRVSANRAPSVFDFSVNFDGNLLTFVDARPTGLSTGYIVTTTPTQRGVDVKLQGATPLTEAGTLLELTFEARPTFYSGKTEISVSPPAVQQFCTEASSFNGLITVSGTCEHALGAPAPTTPQVRLIAVSPNPFNPEARIRYTVSEYADITLELHDVLGRRLRTLYNGPVNAGEHQYILDATDFSGGVYMIAISAGSSRDYRRVMLVK
ncbi:MAG: VWA domain-containing protein [Bacteroidia bacterium]|nr:VWA domain-containing protein [Bacteroidia bacterium]